MRKGYHIMSFPSSTSCNHNPKIILTMPCLLCCGFNLFFLIISSFSPTYIYRWLGSSCCKREFLGCNSTCIDLFFHLLIFSELLCLPFWLVILMFFCLFSRSLILPCPLPSYLGYTFLWINNRINMV